MQLSQEFFLDTYTGVTETGIGDILFPLFPGDRIFLIGDLGSGKSTFVRALLRDFFRDSSLVVRSPTYTYYQKYGTNLYHFDLYRVASYDDLLLLGALDIFQNPDTICLIEWPEILGDRIAPTIELSLREGIGGTRDYTKKTFSQRKY